MAIEEPTGGLTRPHSAPHPAVVYRLRGTGAIVAEPLPTETRLRWAYETAWGAAFFGPFFRWPHYSRLMGWLHERPASRRLIAPFVETFSIDVGELEMPIADYPHFAAFFERRLKPEARPFDPDETLLPAPGDGKLLAYPSLGPETRLPVKGRHVPLAALLGDEHAVYRSGSALVLRLAPYDYHRFHFVSTGVAGPARSLPGTLYSVNPIALNGMPDIYLRNHRMVSFQDTASFGRIAYVEVGAFEVGRIQQTFTPGPVGRGQEKGLFRLGGSTVVLLFEPGRVVFDADLIASTAADLETQVTLGSTIGRRSG
jgi:phosphatidylserine decarboxylase